MGSKSLMNIRHFFTTSRKLGLLNRFKNIFHSSSDQLSVKQVRYIGDNGSENSRTIFPNQSYDDNRLEKQFFEPSNYLNQSPANRAASNHHEWGVKHLEERPTTVETVDERVPRYILKQKWGVNLAEPAVQVQPVSQVTENIEATKNTVKMENSRPTSTASVPPVDLPQSPSISEQKSDPPLPNKEPLVLEPPVADEGAQKLLLNTEDTIGQVDYNDSLLTVKAEDEDLKAWRNVANNTKEHVKKLQEKAAKAVEPVEEEPSELKFTILPEAQQQKHDVVSVRPANPLLDAYIDPIALSQTPVEGPSTLGVRIALHKVNGEKKNPVQRHKTSLPPENSNYI